jgi:3-oxoacyl-[acyl-carrier protein] reductase
MPVAIVTGASRGLGAEIAQSLAADNIVVAVNYAHDDKGAHRVVRAIIDNGGNASAFKFDVTDEAEIQVGVAAIASALGPVDILVNNAIGRHDPCPVEAQTWEYHLEQLRFCVKAPLGMLHAVIADWKLRRMGCVINIGSEAVDIGSANASHYVAAKAAMVGLTRSWARELGPFGIRVNLVAPGFIPVERHRSEPAEALEAYKKNVPLGRLGVPSDVAEMVSFLASPLSNFITGQTFAVNGGRTLT